jgi:C-terminal processing protease CtpA/Prc
MEIRSPGFYKVPIDDKALTNGSTDGMVEALGDPHTAFTDADTAAISLRFAGIV